MTVGETLVTNNFTAAGQSSVFAVASSGGSFALTAQTGGVGSALELDVGTGYVPSPSQFDFQSGQFDSPTASLTVPAGPSNSATYYVIVYAVSLNSSPITYTLTATPLTFSVSAVSPTSIANSGPMTLQILGSQLAGNDTYSLAGPGGKFTAAAAQSTDPTVAYATFNLGGAASGYYSLSVAQPGGQTLTLSNAVFAASDTNTAAAGSLSLQLAVPPVFRKGRSFTGTVSYLNAGVVDLGAPIILVSSGGMVGMAPQGSSNYYTNNLALIGASFDGPAGTLRSAQGWSIDFSASYSQSGVIPFSVTISLPRPQISSTTRRWSHHCSLRDTAPASGA